LPTAAYSPVESTKAPAGYSYEAYKATEAPVAPESARTAPIVPETSNVASESKVVPLGETTPKEVVPQKTGEVTKAASDINETLVKQGFDALTPELQSKYTPESYKTELVKSKDLVTNNYEDAVARASGEKPVGSYEGQILFNEVERAATKVGDGETLSKLASSPLGKKLSLAGQTMGAHGFNDNPNSAVDAIREVQTARTASLGKSDVELGKQKDSFVKDASNAAKTEMKNGLSKGAKWEDFVQAITCGY
ncbi:MAG: hypothetical protein ACYC9R_13100, partial [Nitrosotalea sp.]